LKKDEKSSLFEKILGWKNLSEDENISDCENGFDFVKTVDWKIFIVSRKTKLFEKDFESGIESGIILASLLGWLGWLPVSVWDTLSVGVGGSFVPSNVFEGYCKEIVRGIIP
jgi:hypothetical protein